MLKKGSENKYEQPYSGPHTILQVNNNGTVILQMGAITDTVNIRRIHPFRRMQYAQSYKAQTTVITLYLQQETLVEGQAKDRRRNCCHLHVY